MEEKKYLLGLDIGTNSVGWCLTDKNYNVIKKQGQGSSYFALYRRIFMPGNRKNVENI